MILLEFSKILRDLSEIRIKSSFFSFLNIHQAELYLPQLGQFFKSNRILIDINIEKRKEVKLTSDVHNRPPY